MILHIERLKTAARNYLIHYPVGTQDVKIVLGEAFSAGIDIGYLLNRALLNLTLDKDGQSLLNINRLKKQKSLNDDQRRLLELINSCFIGLQNAEGHQPIPLMHNARPLIEITPSWALIIWKEKIDFILDRRLAGDDTPLQDFLIAVADHVELTEKRIKNSNPHPQENWRPTEYKFVSDGKGSWAVFAL